MFVCVFHAFRFRGNLIGFNGFASFMNQGCGRSSNLYHDSAQLMKSSETNTDITVFLIVLIELKFLPKYK